MTGPIETRLRKLEQAGGGEMRITDIIRQIIAPVHDVDGRLIGRRVVGEMRGMSGEMAYREIDGPLELLRDALPPLVATGYQQMALTNTAIINLKA